MTDKIAMVLNIDIEGDDLTHFLIPDGDLKVTCGQQWSSSSDLVDMVTCPKCLMLIDNGANTKKADPYNYGEKDLYLGVWFGDDDQWEKNLNNNHDGTYDLEEGLEMMTDEWLKENNLCRAAIISLRENCKKLLSINKQLEKNSINTTIYTTVELWEHDRFSGPKMYDKKEFESKDLAVDFCKQFNKKNTGSTPELYTVAKIKY